MLHIDDCIMNKLNQNDGESWGSTYMRDMHLGGDFEVKIVGSTYMRGRLICEYIRYQF